jgi:hypothetical protein
LHKKYLIIQNLSDADAARRRTVRKGSAFPEAISLTSFPEAEPQEKVFKGTQRKAIGIPHCAAASRNPVDPARCVPIRFRYFLCKALVVLLLIAWR